MTTLTLARLDEIETAASKATPGPWYHVQPYMIAPKQQTIHGPVSAKRVDFVSTTERPVHGPSIIPMPQEGCSSVSSHNMAYIAACDPQTVLALVKIARAGLAIRTYELNGGPMYEEWDKHYDALYDALRNTGLIT